jgi:phenylacetate-coenzyme A ligase PaaK-like adenylate-forming protein
MLGASHNVRLMPLSDLASARLTLLAGLLNDAASELGSGVIIDSPRRREQLAAVAQRLPAHVARLSWSQAEIKAERQRALRETLAFAKAKSPWHARRLSGFNAETFAEADLTRLPVMTKSDVMSNWDEVVTDRRLTLAGCNAEITAKLEGKTKDYYLNDYLVIATGGSSGVRGVFPWSWDEFIEIACVTFRYQLRDEPPERLLGRRLLAVIEAGEIVHGSPFLFSVSTDPAAQVQWFPADTPLTGLVTALNAAQPTQINCFGSVMGELGAEALSGRLNISPHRVTTNSEPLLPEARDAVRKVWSVEINNMWGCVEVGHIGIECDGHEGMHMTDDLIITEFVDDRNQPTRDPDAIDRVLVTSLFGRTMPLIRYELTDIPVPDDKSCSCGAHFPLVRGVKGRADDIFVYSGGIHIHPLVFRTPLGQNPDIAEYQVLQTKDGAKIGVVATGPIDIAALRQEVVAGLAKSGLHDAQIEINLVGSLERHKETGKLKRFIPLKC